MEKTIDICRDDLFDYAKLSCRLPNLIHGAITRKIIEFKAAQLGIQVDREELQQAADSFRISRKLHLTEATRLWMQKHSLSSEDFENLIYTNKLSEKLVECLFSDRVDSFFEEHEFDYTQVIMYEILLDDNDLAMELYCALNMGKASFHDTARRYIQEPNIRRAGGYRGIVYCKQLHPDIIKAILAAKPPQLLKPIVTAKGIYLILLEEVIEPKLDEFLRARILSDLFSVWLDREIAQVKVNIDFQDGDRSPVSKTNTESKMFSHF
jgi:parvulin-like peptidyl-prolyl isomerase